MSGGVCRLCGKSAPRLHEMRKEPLLMLCYPCVENCTRNPAMRKWVVDSFKP